MVKIIHKIPLIERMLRIEIISVFFFAIIGKCIGGRIFCRLSHVVLKLEYTCYCKTPIAICSRSMQESSAASRETWVNVFAAVPVGSSPTICSVPAMCMHDDMVPINGHRTNYVYMIDCTWSLHEALLAIQAEWLHIILPARLGYISLIQKIWADFCSDLSNC